MYIRPVITTAQARSIFTRKKWRNPLSFFRRARFKRAELFYVPLHLFEILIQAEKKSWSMVICCDAIMGETAIFQGQDHQHSEQAQGTVCKPTLTSEQVEEQVRKYGRALILDQAMGYGKKGSLQDVKFVETIFYPYWVGYFEKSGRYNFRVADGITGQLQGPKLRHLFLQALRQLS
jgi:hypothetical protein